MAFTTHHVLIRGRLQNNTALNPALLSTAVASTPVIDAISINGVDADMRKFGAGELTTIEAAIKAFVVDKLDFSTSSPAQVAHGNGTVVVNDVDANASLETWTIQFLTPTTYSVTGSVSGAQVNGNTAVAGGVYTLAGEFEMTVTPGNVPFTIADNFEFEISVAPADSGTVTPGTNVGNGTLVVGSVEADATAESWTITFLTATTYSVVGSVSGAQTDGDTTANGGVYTLADEFEMTVTAGGTAFEADDSFTFPIFYPAQSSVVTHQAIGNGTVEINSYDALQATPETWTITFLTPTTYSVVGSVTGITANGDTTESAGEYDNGIFNITVTVGVTPFCVGDRWTFVISL